MGPRWYESAVDRLDQDYEAGNISGEEYQAEMRELNAELRDAAADEAQSAYDDYMGG